MQVILTHEQADFDAIASMLGAYLLQKDAYVVLPNVMNRNVQSFLHLYGADLPFVTSSELPNEPIASITLVDTQSMITLKGMRKDTQVYVIDHHKMKLDFPPHWHFESVDTAACTTHFIEHLQENNGHLSLIQATLLLLGIYEDSGSLSYANTTSQDASAVAYLLDNGASLKIATEFLNPPLSAGQHKVFDDILTHMDSLTIQNCKILVAGADAPDLEDEVSSIAHKVTDLLDPDALFIFVKTKEGIRLVARSITDQINVGDIAVQYGGGGHPRASSALIKTNKENPNQLADILRIFKSELPDYVNPAITVSQLMSKKPLTIQLDTTARQAYQLMQRFGYEGYPVIEDDQVKGLLTRRAVDRALSHKLDMKAASLMEAGDYSVAPQDSLEKLQQIMAESGWGQVPVIDPESKKIIGITTRTDLLKILAGRGRGEAQRKNLAAEIQSALPLHLLNLLDIISLTASQLKLPIFVVGGFVRDLLLKTPSFDLDFVVEGDAIQLATRLSEQYGGKITSHKKFGTAKWQLNFNNPALQKRLHNNGSSLNKTNSLPASIDLISARTEFYEKPSALPTVKQSSIKLDLHRRDFTINTMAIRLDGNHFGDLYDYWGGLNDLSHQNIRVLHSLSFVDDPTRMLRAVRFEQRFGFSIEPRTLQLMKEACNLLDEVSGERIRHEIDQMLLEKHPGKMIARLDQLSLLQQINPALEWHTTLAGQFKQLFSQSLPEDWKFYDRAAPAKQKSQVAYILLLSKLSANQLERVCTRLRLKNHLRQMVHKANDLQPSLPELTAMPASQAAALLEDCSPLVVYCLYLQAADEKTRAVLTAFATQWRWIKPTIDGKQLMEMGVEKGPRIGDILDELKAAWIDNKINSAAEEIRYLKDLLESPKR